MTLTDVWFCSDKCKRKSDSNKKLDGVFEYSKAITFDLLNHLVRKDAVREGDGLAMMDHWSFDLIQFANGNHPKYFTLAHHLLTGGNNGN